MSQHPGAPGLPWGNLNPASLQQYQAQPQGILAIPINMRYNYYNPDRILIDSPQSIDDHIMAA